MKKMYTNKPILETEIVEFDKKELDAEKRIKNLEDKVRMLSESVNTMATALALNSRQFRRATTDINNLTTAIHNHKYK